MTGQELYTEWCNAAGSTDEAYWPLMNRASKEHWNRLASVVVPADPPTETAEQAAHRWIDEHVSQPSRHLAHSLVTGILRAAVNASTQEER